MADVFYPKRYGKIAKVMFVILAISSVIGMIEGIVNNTLAMTAFTGSGTLQMVGDYKLSLYDKIYGVIKMLMSVFLPVANMLFVLALGEKKGKI